MNTFGQNTTSLMIKVSHGWEDLQLWVKENWAHITVLLTILFLPHLSAFIQKTKRPTSVFSRIGRTINSSFATALSTHVNMSVQIIQPYLIRKFMRKSILECIGHKGLPNNMYTPTKLRKNQPHQRAKNVQPLQLGRRALLFGPPCDSSACHSLW